MFKKGLVLALLFTSTIQAAQKTYGNFSVTKVLKVIRKYLPLKVCFKVIILADLSTALR
jgi:hypothetical protein